MVFWGLALPAGRALCSLFGFFFLRLIVLFLLLLFLLHSFAFLFSSLVFGFEPSSLFFFRASGHLLFSHIQTSRHPDIDRGHHQQQQTDYKHLAAHAVETHNTPILCIYGLFSFSSFSTSVGGFLLFHFRFLII